MEVESKEARKMVPFTARIPRFLKAIVQQEALKRQTPLHPERSESDIIREAVYEWAVKRGLIADGIQA